MTDPMYAVMLRRGQLLSRIASQREYVAGIGARLQTPLALADQGLAAARFLYSNPVLSAGVIAALVIRRRGVVGAGKVFWRVWRGYRYFTGIRARLSSRRQAS